MTMTEMYYWDLLKYLNEIEDKSAVKIDLTPKIWTIHIRTDDDIVSDSVLLILVESVDDYSNPNNPLPH